MTIAEFCECERLKTTAFHYWRREIKRRDAGSPPADAAPEFAAPEFAAVQLLDDHVCGAAVEIVAENGYVIRVSEQATSEHLRRVLQAVNELRREAR